MEEKIKGLFKCCSRQSTPDHYQRIQGFEDLEAEEFELENTAPIFTLTKDTLYSISKFLPPPSIVSLTKSNKLFSCLSTKDFWNQYNILKKNIIWDERISPIQIAFSYYWFENDKVERAAKMGLPRAKTFIEQQRRNQRESVAYERNITHYRNHGNPYMSSYILFKKFGK
jgi:hypothetical protein